MSATKGGLTVVHGPFEALEEAFARRVEGLKRAPGAPPILVVAPSRTLADRLERLLAVEKGLPLLGVHFHTFHSLAAAVVEEAGFPDAALVSDPVFHDAVVDRVLDCAKAFGLASELRPRALASAVRSSLRDLIDCGVDPKLVAEHFGSELLKDEEEAARLNALLSLLALYEKELGRLGVLPPSALVKRAAEAAPESAWLSGFAEILYYGFYDLTGLQLDFFEAVTGVRPSKLYFPYREGHPAFRFPQEFFDERLSGRDREAAPGGGPTALGAALDVLFDPAKEPVPVAAGRVALVSASGARDEAWAAAKEVLRLLDEGILPREIAVVARTLEPYRPALAEVFAAEKVPLDLSCGEPILRHPAAKAALDLLTLRERDFPARTVEDLAGSPYFTAADPRRAARWRRLADALGIRAGWLQWRGKLEPRAGADVELRPHRVREGLPGELIPAADARALWDFVSGLRDALGAPPAKWSERAKEARALLSAHLALPAGACAPERDAFAAVEAALEELGGFDRLREPCAWEDFTAAFESKLTRASRDAGDGGLGVRALDAMDARGHRFRAVIMLGLKEKLFPRQVLEDPLLRDAARAALRHPAGYWIGRKAAGHEEERLLFYLAASSAKERLVLIYPRSDEAGKASVPSTYLRELCRAAGLPPPGEGDARRVPRQPVERLRSTPPELLTPREADLLSVLSGGAPAALAEPLGRVAALNDRGPAGSHDGYTGPIISELAELRKKGLSPTALDQYTKCPFRFFASRVLGLGTRDEGVERDEMTAQARGLIYHAVLERFYSSLPESYWSGESDWEGTFQESCASVFAANDWRVLGIYPLLWESYRLDMTARLRDFLAWDLERLKASGLKPRLFEKRLFGAPAEGAPGDVPWTGVVDRIDVSAEKFRVVDYKTRGGKGAKNLAKRVAEGEVHQLPFYAELAGSALGAGRSFGGAELLFLEVENGEERSAELSAEDWGLSRDAYMKIIAERIESIAFGKFPINPDDGEHGHCSWCEFPTVCRKAHGPSRARALVPPRSLKEQANRVGKLLARDDLSQQDVVAAFDILDKWRSSHGFPLDAIAVDLRRAAVSVDSEALVVQRLKRLPSILNKLKRLKTMSLTQMQDIGGCRAVVKTVKDVELLRQHYEQGFMKYARINQKDYISEPKSSGYRSIHLVYRYVSDTSEAYNGKLIEIQIRSRLQHAWATGVEAMGTLLEHSLKSSSGPKEWLTFFTNVGTAFAEMEGTPPVPGTPRGNELKLEIANAAKKLEVEKKLNQVRDALQITSNEEPLKNSHYYLLSLDPVNDKLTISGFEFEALNEATRQYLEAEKTRSQTGVDVVLVSADSFEALRLAYPNYYLDTEVFLSQLKAYLSK